MSNPPATELFGGPSALPLGLPTVRPWLPAERLQKEFEAIECFLSGHPLDDYARRSSGCASSHGRSSRAP